MRERTDEVTRDLGDYDADLVDDVGVAGSNFDSIGTECSTGETDASKEGGLLSRVSNPLVSLFSVRWFGIATAASLAGVFLAGTISLPFSGFLGILVVGAAIGLLEHTRRYAEVAIAGALAAGIAVFFDVLVLIFLGVGIPLVAIAALLGAVVGAIGHYAGRDLRAGVTRDL